MKKICLLLALLILCASAVSCSGIDAEKADDLSVDFLLALLSDDGAGMEKCLHPDHISEAMPDDEFYEYLKNNLDITVGETLTALDSTDKKYSDDTSLGGRVLICDFVAEIDWLYYDVEIIILDDKSGYGIVACNFDFCTDDKYYTVSE